MRDFIALDLDSDFCDFNICSLWDPSLKPGGGPTESALFKLAYQARQGERFAIGEYFDTLDWTLREETFECFQRLHGPLPIRYEHWFYSKLQQLLGIFLYDQLLVYGLGEYGAAGMPRTERPWEEGSGRLTGTPAVIQPSELTEAFSPQDWAEYDWMTLLRSLLSAGEDRLEEFDRILQERIEQTAKTGTDPNRTNTGETNKHWLRNKARDSIIVSCLDRGVDRGEVCRILDRKGIGTTPRMRKDDVNRWAVAWEDPEFHNNVQQLFTKVKHRHNRVKS